MREFRSFVVSLDVRVRVRSKYGTAEDVADAVSEAIDTMADNIVGAAKERDSDILATWGEDFSIVRESVAVRNES